MNGRVKVCLVGAQGRMGQVILEEIAETEEMKVVQKVDLKLSSHIIGSRPQLEVVGNGEISEIDLVIDFTNPKCTLGTARWCVDHKKPLVTGTTGLSEEETEELRGFGKTIPIVWAPNMSLGVNLIDALLPKLALLLEGFEIEIIETHHKMKKDFPSGTASRFANTLAGVRGGKVIYGRAKGAADSRPTDEIYVHALRGGTVPGEHIVCFFGPDEVIKIEHQALSRKIFARGVVKAALWVFNKEAGLYSMRDVLGV